MDAGFPLPVPEVIPPKKRSIRVRTWEEFTRIAAEKRAKSIVYIIAQSIPARNLTSLKLILPLAEAQYIFIDFAKGNELRQTEIPIRQDRRGNRFIDDEDVKRFLRKKMPGKDLQIYSYWTI